MAEHLFVGNLDATAAGRLVEAASDLVLLLDAQGVILDVRVHDGNLAGLDTSGWSGRAWVDTVTIESHDKIRACLRDATGRRKGGAGGDTVVRWRQVNHPVPGGDDLPVLYVAVPVGNADGGDTRLIAFGRELRSVVALQRRLVEAQQTMERDYWRFREADTRYRHVLQSSNEALLVVDGQNLRIVEVNPAADGLAGRHRGRLVGAPLSSLFTESSADALQGLLAAARAVGKRDPVRLTLADGQTPASVTASLFRQDQLPFLLLRVVPVSASAESAAAGSPGSSAFGGLHETYFEQAVDALVYTDAQGRVLAANRTFAMMAQLSAEDQARGEMLDRWLGRTGVELSVLVTNLRQRGSVGLFTTALRGEFGASIDVEISASVLQQADGPRLAFSIRDISRRLQGEERTPERISRSVGELAELVGRVPLKDIVSDTTDLIEQLCIEAALQMTQGNRASAAQLLGLSRQSLYVKLNRFGLGASGAGEADEERPTVNID